MKTDGSQEAGGERVKNVGQFLDHADRVKMAWKEQARTVREIVEGDDESYGRWMEAVAHARTEERDYWRERFKDAEAERDHYRSAYEGLRKAVEEHQLEGKKAHRWGGIEDYAKSHDERNRRLYAALPDPKEQLDGD